MAQPNTLAPFSKTPRISGVEITAANTKSDGSGTIATDIFLVGTVDANVGGFLRSVEFYPTATTAATATTATVGRLFVSTQASGATTASNTNPLGELPLASQSADNSSTAVFPIVFVVNKAIPAGYSILATNHAAPAANSKWKAVATWGDYA